MELKVQTLVASLMGIYSETKDSSPNAVKYLKELGITHYRSMPDNFGDYIIFFNCRNVPEVLPEWLVKIERTSLDYAGRGAMTQEIAEDIIKEATL